MSKSTYHPLHSQLHHHRRSCLRQVFFLIPLASLLVYLLLYSNIDLEHTAHFPEVDRSTSSAFVQQANFSEAWAPTAVPWYEVSWVDSFKRIFKSLGSHDLPAELFPPSSDWQKIRFGKSSKFFIYSAFTQLPGGIPPQNSSDNANLVTILSSPTLPLEEFQRRNFTVRCIFRWKSNNSAVPNDPVAFTEVVTVERMGHWNKRVAGMLFRCFLPQLLTPRPDPPFWVGLVILRCNAHQKAIDAVTREQGGLIPLHYHPAAPSQVPAGATPGNTQPRYTVSLCVLPMYDFNKVLPFLEWLEYYKMMGVEQFTFYNLSIGPATSCLLENAPDYYHRKISFQVLPWHNFPLRAHIDVREGPSLPEAAYDCLYRHKNGVSEFLSIIDLDEFITPATGFDQDVSNFTEMISKINAQHNLSSEGAAAVGAYMFRNAFYNFNFIKDQGLPEKCARWRGDGDAEDVAYQNVCKNAITLQYDKRNYIFEHAHRSKYFIRPEAAVAVGNHEVAVRTEGGYTMLYVNETEAFLRHYRFWDKGRGILKDITVHPFSDKFAPKLVAGLSEAVKHFRTVCNLSWEEVLKK